MRITDVIAIVMMLAAGGAFAVGESALAQADDLRALYWLLVGAASLWAAVQVGRPAANA